MTTIPRSLVGASRALAHAYLTLPYAHRKLVVARPGLVVGKDETEEQALFRHSRATGGLGELWDQVRAAQLKAWPDNRWHQHASILSEKNPFKV